MASKILYPTQGGTIAILTPITECGLTVEQIASKDVPAGVPYLIVDESDLPTDRTYRNAWTADFSEPDGIGLGPEAFWASQQPVTPPPVPPAPTDPPAVSDPEPEDQPTPPEW